MEKKQLPILKTQRLTLREISLSDVNDIFEYASKANVGPRAGWLPHVVIQDTKSWVEHTLSEEFSDSNVGVFSIINNENNKMIGTIGLHRYDVKNNTVEIGYVLNPAYWGNGIMLEACIAIIKWCFESLNIYRLEVGHYEFNYQSRRVIEKSGFKLEGVSRQKIVLVNGERCDLYNYAILKYEYFNNELPWQINKN
ncbi:MAG: GCN5-related N-acetyltransferase [Haloplasmataceae bacterium]|nr:GCN5-related N-acetyltransferase [Haloplasmataceae bacterium]